jgi:hypothetical protein
VTTFLQEALSREDGIGADPIVLAPSTTPNPWLLAAGVVACVGLLALVAQPARSGGRAAQMGMTEEEYDDYLEEMSTYHRGAVRR